MDLTCFSAGEKGRKGYPLDHSKRIRLGSQGLHVKKKPRGMGDDSQKDTGRDWSGKCLAGSNPLAIFTRILSMHSNIFHLPVLNFFLAASDHLSLKQITVHENTRLQTQLQSQRFTIESGGFTDLVASLATFLFVSAKVRERSFLSSPLYHRL